MTESERTELKNKLNKEFPPIIARADIAIITGGVLKPSYMANLDCQGCGVANPVKMDKKVVYLRENLVDFIVDRMN